MTLLVTLEPADAPFGWAPRALIEDERLSWKAKGLWLYLNSRPPGWKVHISDLQNRATDGEKSIRSGVKELRDTDWMEVRRRTDPETGQVVAWDWILRVPPDAENRQVGQMPETDNVDSPHVDEGARSNKKGNEKKGSSSVHPSDDPLPRVGAMDREELLAAGNAAIAARFMPAVRRLRLDAPLTFGEDREVGILRQLLESGVDPTEIEDGIEGVILLRDRGALDWLPKGQAATMRALYNTRTGACPLLPQAAHYARKHRDRIRSDRETRRYGPDLTPAWAAR